MTIEEAGKKRTPGEWYAKHDTYVDQSMIQSDGADNPIARTIYADAGDRVQANALLLSKAYLIPEMVEAMHDALQSLKRLPSVDGAYRVTCIAELEQALAKVRE